MRLINPYLVLVVDPLHRLTRAVRCEWGRKALKPSQDQLVTAGAERFQR